MVGSHKGQSFHELMPRSGYFANPMMLVVSGRDARLEHSGPQVKIRGRFSASVPSGG